MAKRKFLVGMLVLVLVFGMTVIGCGSRCVHDGNCYVRVSGSQITSQRVCASNSCNLRIWL